MAKDWKEKIIALWTSATILPAIFVVSLIGLAISFYLLGSNTLGTLALVGVGESRLPLAVMIIMVTACCLIIAALALSQIGRFRSHLVAKDWKGKIIALWSGAVVLPAVFVVLSIGLPISIYMFESRNLAVLAFWVALSSLPLAVMLLVTMYWLSVAALAHAHAWHAAIALTAFIVSAVVLSDGNILQKPSNTTEAGNTTVSGEPEIPEVPKTLPREQDAQEQRIQESQECLLEALQLVQHIEGESQEEREAKDLEEHWIQYLQRIQAQGNYANWFGKPCDLYLQNHTHYANDAVTGGFATITAIGNGLQSVNVSVSLTSNAGTTIFLPVGTQFTSASEGTQNMISASSVSFTFVQVSSPETEPQATYLRDRRLVVQNTRGLLKASYIVGDYAMRKVMFVPPSSPVPRTLVQDVPSYCVNRWQDVPNSESKFSVSDADSENPLVKLVSCLEDISAIHIDKQLAVWMISDNLIKLTQQQLEDKFLEEGKSKFHPTAAALADIVKKADPTISDADIEEIRRMSPEELDEARSQLLPRMLPLMRKQAAQQVQNYKDIAGPLLHSCGYDLSGSAFFSQ